MTPSPYIKIYSRYNLDYCVREVAYPAYHSHSEVDHRRAVDSIMPGGIAPNGEDRYVWCAGNEDIKQKYKGELNEL